MSLCKKLDFYLIPYSSEEFSDLYDISKDGFSLYSSSDNNFYIFFNSRMPYKRINFTIAHELGHIILNHHFFVDGQILKHENNDEVWEKHANIFAQNLLMPSEITYKLKDKYNLKQFSETFDVSIPMVKTRLNKLYEDRLWFRKI